jgi:hypothetical protein
MIPFTRLGLQQMQMLGVGAPTAGLPRFITDLFNLLQSSPTYAGGPLTATDYLGNLVTSPAGTPALEGGRLATTVAEGATLGPELVVNGGFDSDTGWVKGTNISISEGLAHFVSTPDAQVLSLANVVTAGRRYLISLSVSNLITGSIFIREPVNNSASTYTIDGDFSAELVAASTFLAVRALGVTTLDIDNISVREVIPTWYDTELDGTPTQPSVSIPTRSGTKKWYQEPFANPFGYSNWPARTNLFLNSNTPVTQGITTTAQAYTISVLGTGDVTVSGAAAGTATEGAPLTVTATAGTLTCTVTGTLSRVQAEAGAFASPWIETLATTVTRAATNLTNPLTLAPQLQLVVIPATTGTAGTMLDDGTNKLSYNGANLIFTDGVTTLSAATTLTAGTAYTIGVKGLAGDWALSLNTVDLDTDATGTVVAWATAKLGRNDADGDYFAGYFPNVAGYVGTDVNWYKTTLGA